jgi:uncharacterized membrane protein YfcA
MEHASQIQFRLAAFITILSALLAGYFNVGSLYLFGLPIVPLLISLLVLWTTKVPVPKKAVATLIALLFIPAGFFAWAWWNEVTLNWKW